MTWYRYCESVFDVLIVVGITDLVMLVSVVVGVFFRVGLAVLPLFYMALLLKMNRYLSASSTFNLSPFGSSNATEREEAEP